jgi:type I restriction enzyme, R subunit
VVHSLVLSRAFYDALADNQSAVEAMGTRIIATELVTQVRNSITIDWALREAPAPDQGDG